jgi:hypothetical protein
LARKDLDFFQDIEDEVKVETVEDIAANHMYWAGKTPEEVAARLDVPVEKITNNKTIKNLIYDKEVNFMMGMTQEFRDGNYKNAFKAMHWLKHVHGWTEQRAEQRAQQAQIENERKKVFIDAPKPLSELEYAEIVKQILKKDDT